MSEARAEIDFHDAPAETETDWLEFLASEGLEVLAAYRAIRNTSVRAMFVRLMKEAAQAERDGNKDLN